MDTKELTAKYFEYMSEMKWDEFLTLFADDIVMDEQLFGHISGIEKVKTEFVEPHKQNENFIIKALETVVEDNESMVIWHIKTFGADGQKVEANGANYFKTKNGKITYVGDYHDTIPFAPFFDDGNFSPDLK